MRAPARLAELARSAYRAYETKDRQILEDLLAADFTFSSPRDDHIDRAAYFERCWPNAERIRRFRFIKLVEDAPDVFVLYEAERAAGGWFRNTEVLSFEDGKLKSVEVYFGRDL